MAKYNLLEDDDIFDEEDDLTENDPAGGLKDDKEEIDTSDEIDIDIDEDLLNIESPETELDEQDLQEDIEIDKIDDIEETISPETEPEIQEFEPEIQKEEPIPVEDEKPFLTEDFEDDKQSGINYKPIVIGGVIIIFLLLGYAAIDRWVLGDSIDSVTDAEPTDEQVKTQEQIVQEREAERKAAFLSKVAGKTSADISVVNSAIENAQSSAKLSSVLLYDEAFLFEVFGSDRDELARVNMSLKNNMSSNNFEVISSQTRPGSNGGVFGLFKGTLSSGAGSGSKGVQASFNTINDLEKWIKDVSASNSLKVTSLVNKYVKEENDFRKFEVETTLTGPIDACNTFLKKLSSDGNQIQIHKLNLNAVDQKSFQSKKYQLKLILEVFV